MKTICASDLAALHEQALHSERHRSRLLLHRSHADRIQEMCIGLLPASRIAPHRQPGRQKSYWAITGQLLVEYFDGAGRVVESLTLEPLGSGKPFLLRFDASRWHTVRALSEWVVYIEIIEGPHDDTTTEWLDASVASQMPANLPPTDSPFPSTS